MSTNWIDNRLDEAVGKEVAEQIRIESMMNPDNVQSCLVHISKEGEISSKVLDSLANIIK